MHVQLYYVIQNIQCLHACFHQLLEGDHEHRVTVSRATPLSREENRGVWLDRALA